MIDENTHQICEFIVLLLQKANDEDIRQFLVNCSKDILSYKEDTLTNKEFLIYIVSQALIKHCTLLKFTKETGNHLIKLSLIWTVIRHISALAYSYYSILPIDFDRLTNNKIKSDWDFPIDEMKDMYKISNNIPEILHILIENYTKYQFYYAIDNNFINKIQITPQNTEEVLQIIYDDDDEENVEEYETITRYRIKEVNRYVCLVNPYDNIRIKTPISKHLLKCGSVMNFNAFNKMNSAITKALSHKHVYCNWCYPDKKSTSHKKCLNCRELQSAFNELKQKDGNNKLSEFDLNKELTKITGDNLYQLRQLRAEFLFNILKETKVSDKNLKKRIKSLIQESFQ